MMEIDTMLVRKYEDGVAYFGKKEDLGKVLDPTVVGFGKWIIVFGTETAAAMACFDAVRNGIVVGAKHFDSPEKSIACFYMDGEDIDAQKRTIEFFLDRGFIPKTNQGRYKNISFKLNSQTAAGEYGEDFHPLITLEQFIDLGTGKWIR